MAVATQVTRSGLRRLAATIFAAAWVLGYSPAAARGTDDPAAVLRAHGLKQVNRSWLTPLEIELRRDLAELPKRRERIIVLERDLNDRIEANRRAWKSNQPAIAALKSSLAQLGTDDPRRAALQQRIETLKRTSFEPKRLSARRDVRTQVVAWGRERDALAAAIVRIRQVVPQLQQVYDRVAQSTALLEALSRLGDDYRLGPMRSYKEEIERLADYERLIYTPWTPVYWQGGHLRFTGLVAERIPITFSWTDVTSEAATLTHSAAEAAGIAIPDDAPSETIPLGRNRQMTAHRVVVPKVRIGKLVLEAVTVLVLPPEAEDWGCRLGRHALSGQSIKLEPERMRLWIDAGS